MVDVQLPDGVASTMLPAGNYVIIASVQSTGSTDSYGSHFAGSLTCTLTNNGGFAGSQQESYNDGDTTDSTISFTINAGGACGGRRGASSECSTNVHVAGTVAVVGEMVVRRVLLLLHSASRRALIFASLNWPGSNVYQCVLVDGFEPMTQEQAAITAMADGISGGSIGKTPNTKGITAATGSFLTLHRGHLLLGGNEERHRLIHQSVLVLTGRQDIR